MKTRKRKNRIAPMQLMARDASVILSVYENRFLKRDQIQRLHFAGVSPQATSARLKKLSDHKFLDKLQRPVAGGASQAVYALDKRGADVVATTLEIDRHKVRWKRDNNRVEWLFMDHTLGISEFKVCLDVALTGRQEEIFFYQRGDKSLLRRVSDPSGKKKCIVVAPDAFFGIQAERGKYIFFLEVDMGTETLKRFQEKVIAYKQYWKSGKFKEDYAFNHFRVLTVAESDRRLANLIQATGKVGGRQMFVFTTFAGLHNVGIFKPIWLAPDSTQAISIVE
ncbi:MAG: replication-relaxation family protein [Thermoleophilia bacterium]